ncbi:MULTISPECIES: ABC transporter substrate-binding protein [unclassified Methylobacterium]|uniref:ABC transporter substrate-binding protein n=1 Tax=unclassified Methylobacterium TaxID=2615210 RepID=UPI0011C9A223|nr:MULTISPECIES: ABC transporter substrate-binding protein [unclassified Methylobacterium]TXM66816.1 ABC transporter substrate-binding protein [Methylobacterium sp. WL120]TXM69729.1 ABC transporter substrate-binding protein [Methylobacterium sp. WL12]TXN78984.1 ABC transporter substrate-binding protein [Methylobacterium sp. WL8]
MNTNDLTAARADLAPTGVLRAAINFGNPVLAQRDPVAGEPRGVSVVLATELARRLGVPVEFHAFEAAGKAFEALKEGEVNVAFLAREPERAAELAFTAPYVNIEGTYLVLVGSPLHGIDDLDRAGIRIAVGLNAAYDLFLTRTLRHAELVRAPTSAAAVDLFLDHGLEAAAGVRQPLERVARERSGLRVVNGRFTAIDQAMCMIPGRPAGLLFLMDFTEDAKRSGLVEKGLAESGQDRALVAPLETGSTITGNRP